jgi:ribonucleoside-triphosphate reductase
MTTTMSQFAIPVQFVSSEFIKEMRDLPNPQNPISEFTFYRTYSRYINQLGRRETWLEAAVRSAEYSVSLGVEQLKRSGSWIEKVHASIFAQEAEDLIKAQYNLQVFVSGRTLYTGGSEASYKYPLSNFNCSSAVIDSFDKIGEMFYLLMVGTGFGFRILREDVAKLPKIRQDIIMQHQAYVPRPKNLRADNTFASIKGYKSEILVIDIGDSKEGWMQAINYYFQLLTDSVEEWKNVSMIEFNYNSIRPKGERLKIFGGTASGPGSMQAMFTTIDAVIKDRLDERLTPILDGKLRPIHLLDICNAVAYNVVSGGVRRSAQICLFDQDDYECLFAKYGLNGFWKQESKDTYDYIHTLNVPVPHIKFHPSEFDRVPNAPARTHLAHRRMSNNSALFYKKPSKDFLHMIIELLKTEGEPGFVNAEEALRRFPWFKGVNPCVEILLDDRGLCNLSTIPVINHVHDGVLNLVSLLKAAELSARIGVRMTTINLELPEWDAKQKQHRLTGCSLTGWQDMIEAIGYTRAQEIELLKLLKKVTKDETTRYAAFLRVPCPNNTTAIKPEGTQSLLAGGVSSGLHAAHAPWYIRRIRVSATDPLCTAMESMGWNLENEVGQGVTYTDPNGDVITTEIATKIISFALKSPSKRTKDDFTVEEQFETYFTFQEHYTDQNTSNTITVKPHEWEVVESTLWERWDDMLAVSFLASDGGTYEKAPLEAITEWEYNIMTRQGLTFDPAILEQFETKEEFDLTDAAGCETGACPIR